MVKKNSSSQLSRTSCIDKLRNELIFKLFNLDSTLRGVCAGDSFGLLLRSLRRNFCGLSFKYSSYESKSVHFINSVHLPYIKRTPFSLMGTMDKIKNINLAHNMSATWNRLAFCLLLFVINRSFDAM